ncbi:Nmad2 family putative nucleotide modification protein [Sideroxydans sp.]
MSKAYMYVVDRDFGFAPNPFHNLCTLATCKPRIRRVAKKDDWIIGMGGGRLRATGRCIFAMKVSKSITFNEYWTNPLYRDKKPVRNGSKKMMVGDNIYHLETGIWQQLNSHHSYPDGSPNPHNVENDTQTNAVLVSEYFFYFGAAAIEIPPDILRGMDYVNRRNHRVYVLADARLLISYIENNFTPNKLLGDPFDFEAASSRYSSADNKVTVDG